jgi:hypothetical protein
MEAAGPDYVSCLILCKPKIYTCWSACTEPLSTFTCDKFTSLENSDKPIALLRLKLERVWVTELPKLYNYNPKNQGKIGLAAHPNTQMFYGETRILMNIFSMY